MASERGTAKEFKPATAKKASAPILLMANSSHSGQPAAMGDPLAESRSARTTSSNGGAVRELQPPVRRTSKPHPSPALPEEWAQVCSLALKQLDRCVSLEPKVLQGNNPDAVHDLRVATRRLQQVLDLIFPSPRPREIRKLRQRLKRCRSSLSEVRNCDVLLERVDATLARKRTAHREARKAIRQYLLTRRSATFEKALRKLARVNLSELYVRMKDFLLGSGGPFSASENSERHSGAPTPSVELFYAHIGENLQTMWEALEDQMARSRRKPEAAVLHRVRIAAKRLRYLVEVIHAFDVPGSPEALIWLRNLQKRLGQWHDLVVFEETVIEMIADPGFLRDHMELGLEIEKLILRNRVLKVKLEGNYLEATADQSDLLRTKEWVSRIIASPSAAFAHA